MKRATTSGDFRRIALGLPGAVECEHMDHPDFRVGVRIFATLGYPDENHGMVRLRPEQQQQLVRKDRAFTPAKGAWGRGGATLVHLARVTEAALTDALTLAWRNLAPTIRLSRLVLSEIRERFTATAAREIRSALELAHIPLLPEPGRWRDRIHLGILKVAAGDTRQFRKALKLAETDWRDLLCWAGLENEDWPAVLKGAGFRVP